MNEAKHWEIYLDRTRATGATPWAIVEWDKGKVSVRYASSIVIKTMSYTGRASRPDRPQFVVHCFGILRESGNVFYVEPHNAPR